MKMVERARESLAGSNWSIDLIQEQQVSNTGCYRHMYYKLHVTYLEVTILSVGYLSAETIRAYLQALEAGFQLSGGGRLDLSPLTRTLEG